MKSIVIYGTSAVEAWDLGLCAHAELVETLDFAKCARNAADLHQYDDALPQLTRPLHVLVADKAARRQSGKWCCHVLARDLPRHSFFKVEDNVYVAAPWLCYVLFASSLDFPHAALLGMEMCGRYSTLPLHVAMGRTSEGKDYLERPPLTSSSHVERYVRAFNRNRHSSAYRAAKLLVNGSRSPRESMLHILMQPPPRQGGYSLHGYEINQPIDLPPEMARIAGTTKFECDFCWDDSGLVVEYDGQDYHANDAQRGYDNMRRAMLTQLGNRVIVVDKHTLKSPAQLDATMQMIASHIGAGEVKQDERSVARRRALLQQLLNPETDLYKLQPGGKR